MSFRAISLKDRQRAVIDKVLTPPVTLKYVSVDGKAVEQAPLQVLIVDAFANDMLTALLNPRDFRRHGVTLRTQVDAPRGTIPDVFANYLLSPTPENVAWLLKDVQQRKLYERVSVAFTGAASPQLLAALAAQLTAPSPIVRVIDLHTNFISLEQNIFSLGLKDSFVKLHCTHADKVKIREDFIMSIVSGLLSVFVSLGVVPIIRSQPGGSSAAVSSALDAALRENMTLFRSSSGLSNFRRPLLLLFDRDIDYNALLHHTWTYQALVHDCFDLQLNSLDIPVVGSRDAVSRTMDKGTDLFWAKNASSPFPEVAQAIEAELKRYRSDVEAINQRAGDSKSNGVTADPEQGRSSAPSTSALAAVIASLPELSERKSTIDTHTNIATAVLDEINKRALDTYYELESQIMNAVSSHASAATAYSDFKSAVMDEVRGAKETNMGEKRGSGTDEDKMRLFLIFYLAFGSHMTENEMSEFRNVLSKLRVPLSPVSFIKNFKGFRHESGPESPQSRPAVSLTGSKRALVKGIISNVVDRGYRGIASVAKNAKNLMIESQRSMACARILNLFVNDRSRAAYGSAANDILDGYLLFDPKVERSDDDAHGERLKRMIYTDAIVFTIGGGNYVEYEDCMNSVQASNSGFDISNIVYGTTELMNGKEFLTQLSRCHE